jgi:hypothetical protein
LTLKKANRISIPIDGTFGNVSFPIRWAKMNDRFTRTWTTVMGTYAEDSVMYSLGYWEASYLVTHGCWVDAVPVR